MPARERAILVKILGDAAGLGRALSESDRKLSGLEKRFAQAGRIIRAASVAGAAAVAGIGVASVKMAFDFDRSMREVNTLLGRPAAGFEELKSQVLDLSIRMGRTASETVPALYQAISAGVPAGNVLAFLATANESAVGGVTDLSVAVDALTTATNAFGSQGLTAEDAADILFTAVKGGKTTFDELAGTIGRVAPLASGAGVSFAETTASIATLTTQGFATAEAVTGIRSAIQATLRPTEDLTRVFQQAGFESAQAAIEGVGLVGALDLIAQAADGDIGALTKMLGSVEAVNAVLGLTGDNAAAVQDQMFAMAQRTGAAGEAFREMEQSASRAWDRFRARVEVGLIRLGDRLLPSVVKALDAFSAWWDRNAPEIERAAARLQRAVSSFLGNFKTGLEVLFPHVRGLFSFVLDNQLAMVAAFTAIGAAVALAFGPVGVATAAIVAAIALIGRFKDDWRAAARDVIGVVKGLANAFFELQKIIIESLVKGVELALEGAINVARNVVAKAPKLGKVLSGFIPEVDLDLSGAADALNASGEAVRADINAGFDALLSAFGATEIGTSPDTGWFAYQPASPGSPFDATEIAQMEALVAAQKAAEAASGAIGGELAPVLTDAANEVGGFSGAVQTAGVDSRAAGEEVADSVGDFWEAVKRHTEEGVEAALEAEQRLAKLRADMAQVRAIGLAMNRAGLRPGAVAISLPGLGGTFKDEAAAIRFIVQSSLARNKPLSDEEIAERVAMAREQIAEQRDLEERHAAAVERRQFLRDNPELVDDAVERITGGITQQITVNVEDGSPAALARAVQMGAEQAGRELQLELAAA